MAESNNSYKWFILALVVFTNLFLTAIPTMGISVMSKEISDDLQLNLVQVGVMWGAVSLPGIVASLLGGMVCDKFGSKRVLVVGSLLAGLMGMARGWSVDFLTITTTMVLCGAITPFVSMSGIKALGQWFPSHQLGLANGVYSMGMALGFLIGSLLSATTLSPLLGGWRNVLMLYGLIGAMCSIPWFFTRVAPGSLHASGASVSFLSNLKHVAGLKNIWLLGLTLFGVSGAIQGALGYLPLYLRNLGWQPVNADGALSAFHMVSMLCVMPVALWSDRLGSRKRLLLFANLLIAAGLGLLGFVGGGLILAAVVCAGLMRDAFMALFTTMVIETRKVGAAFAGTAIGFTMGFGALSNIIAPPIGNSLASIWPGAPFLFWAALCVFGMVCLSLVEAGARPKDTAVGELAPVPAESGD